MGVCISCTPDIQASGSLGVLQAAAALMQVKDWKSSCLDLHTSRLMGLQSSRFTDLQEPRRPYYHITGRRPSTEYGDRGVGG